MNVRVEFTVFGADEDAIESEVNARLAEFAPHARHWRTQVIARANRQADGSVLIWEAEVTAFRETTGSASPAHPR